MDTPDSPGLAVDTPNELVTPPRAPQGAPHHADRPEAVVSRVEELRAEVEHLTGSEKLDKECALQVTRLFHSMEMLLRHECHVRDAEIARVRTDLEHVRLTNELDRLSSRQLQEEAVPTRRASLRR